MASGLHPSSLYASQLIVQQTESGAHRAAESKVSELSFTVPFETDHFECPDCGYLRAWPRDQGSGNKPRCIYCERGTVNENVDKERRWCLRGGHVATRSEFPDAMRLKPSLSCCRHQVRPYFRCEKCGLLRPLDDLISQWGCSCAYCWGDNYGYEVPERERMWCLRGEHIVFRDEFGGFESHGSCSAHRPASSKTSSRLLDLPPEMRNRIYQFAAVKALEVPVKVVYEKPDEDMEDLTWYTDDVSMSVDAPSRQENVRLREEREAMLRSEVFKTHDERRGDQARNCLALLQTCRQVYREAAQVFYSHMSVDARQTYLLPSIPKKDSFYNTFALNTQFIGHMELEIDFGQELLFSSNSYTELPVRMGLGPQCAMPEAVNEAYKMRHHFRGLRSITLYASPGREYDDKQPCGPAVTIHLITSSSLCGHFPKLTDIMTVNAWGGERFRKRPNGKWETFYARETLPWDFRDDSDHWTSPWFYARGTGLSTPMTLGALGDWSMTGKHPYVEGPGFLLQVSGSQRQEEDGELEYRWWFEYGSFFPGVIWA